MRKTRSLFYYIVIFVGAQLAWFLLLGLWIYWYVTNYILLNEFGDKLDPNSFSGTMNVTALVGGLILLTLLSLSITLIFVYLTRQMNLTRLYDTFIANVTHELKSPLSSIQLYLETIRKRKVPREKLEQFSTLMLKDVERLNDLISSILYLSSFEQKKMARSVAHDYHIYPADALIREVLDEILTDLKYPREEVTIEGQVYSKCVVDRYWLKIVFSNLIDNAAKYAPDNKVLNISLSEGPRYFFIEISDQGVGIAPRDQKKIFNKFQRIYNPESPNVKGTGLGLYWVKEIVTHHGGKISVSSAGKNKGSSFRVALPVFNASKRRYMNRLLQLNPKRKPIAEVTDE